MLPEPQTILITGGTGKLGSVFIRHFLRKGWTVAYTSRSTAKIAALKESLVAEGEGESKRLHGIEVDLEHDDGVRHVVDHLAHAQLRPRCLVNNARNIKHLALERGPLPERGSWWGEFLMGAVVPFELTMALAGQEGSQLVSVVNVASMYGVVAANPCLYDDPTRQSPINYGVAKAALIHLTKELAVRLAPRGIRVNAISYGGVEGRVSEEFKARYARLVPCGVMLDEADVVGGLDFLASDFSAGMHGHNLVVDGGWSIW